MKIKSYPKSELAMLYFPDSQPRVAVNHLNEWIKRCHPRQHHQHRLQGKVFPRGCAYRRDDEGQWQTCRDQDPDCRLAAEERN